MKYVSIILAATLIGTLGGALVASAAGDTYVPLVTIPGVTDAEAGQGIDLTSYLVSMMKFLVAAAGALSIVMLIIAGTQYIAAGISPDAKDSAKEHMTNAIIGLVLVLVSYVILNTINPNLVNFNLALKSVGEVQKERQSGTTGVAGAAWPDDSIERNILRGANVGVLDTKGSTTPCKTIGEERCTSVYGLPDKAIQGVIALKRACPDCAVTITGGTEYWGHQTHGGPGRFAAIVDLDNSPNIDNFIKQKGGTPVSPEGGCGLRTADHYHITGTPYAGVYVDEGNHWHVCY